VGKSSFLDATVRDSRDHGFSVFHGRAIGLENPPPFLVLQEAILHAEAGRGASSRNEPVVPQYLTLGPSGGPFGFLPGDESPAGGFGPFAANLLSAAEGAEGRYGSERQRLFDDFAEPLFAALRGGPALLALDDLQFADLATVEFLTYLGTRLHDRALWVLVTVTPLERLPPPLREAVSGWVERGIAERLALRPLTERELEEFARWVDPKRVVSSSEVSRWHEATGGIPTLVEQIVRGRELGSRLGRETEGRIVLAPREFLSGLSEPELRLLTVAAVAGHEFTFALLQQATGEAEEPLAESLEHFVDLGILRERPGEHFEFAREDLRFELYSRLTGPRRRILHRRVGEAIEGLGAPDLANTFALARHFYLGHVDAKAVTYNRRAAGFATLAHASAVAAVHLDQALDAQRRAFPDDLAGELDLVLQVALERDRLGELAVAERLLRQTLARAPVIAAASEDQRALLRLLLGRVLADQGRWDLAERSVEEALPTVESATDPLLKVYALRLRGEILFYRAEYAEALTYQEEAIGAAERAHNARELAIQRVRWANVLSMLPGRVDEALGAYRAAGARLRELDDKSEAAYTALCYGVVLSQHGKLKEGLAELQGAARLAEEAHDLRRLGWVEFNIADLERARRRLPEAEDHNRRARELLERVGDRFGLGQTYLNEGKVHLLAGDPGLATTALAEAGRLFREQKLPADEIEVLLRQAEVDLARGQLDAARAKLTELDAQGLARIRPDLADDFHEVENRVRAQEASAGGRAGR
jgi:tetratricopeptide (TPR) repeat protein